MKVVSQSTGNWEKLLIFKQFDCLILIYIICRYTLIVNMTTFDQPDIKAVHHFNSNYFGDFDGFQF